MAGAVRPFIPEAAVWAKAQWGTVDLRDARREARAVEIGTCLAQNPAGSLPAQLGSATRLKAVYRLLGQKQVSHARLSQPHWEATRQAAGAEAVVLLIQDVTEVDCTRYQKTMTEVGPIGDGRGRGMLLHSTLAVLPSTRRVLGLMHQQPFKRCPIPEGQSRRARPKADRESRVWGQAVVAIGAPPPGSRWVVVTDRAGDNTDFLLTCQQQADFLVRLAHDHRLVTSKEAPASLLPTARAWPAAGHLSLALPATPTRTARIAQLRVSFGPLTIRAPAPTAALPLWVVRVWEVDPPPAVEPLEWLLATSVPVESLPAALERVDWYTARWLSEDYHQCLKSGCRIEHRDLEHLDRLQRLLGFLALVAVRLLQLRQEARLQPDALATTVVEPLVVQVLSAAQHLDPTTLTIAAFWRAVARLGGFLGRKRDGEPGWKTLWRGWQHLLTLLEGVQLAAALADLPPRPPAPSPSERPPPLAPDFSPPASLP